MTNDADKRRLPAVKPRFGLLALAIALLAWSTGMYCLVPWMDESKLDHSLVSRLAARGGTARKDSGVISVDGTIPDQQELRIKRAYDSIRQRVPRNHYAHDEGPPAGAFDEQGVALSQQETRVMLNAIAQDWAYLESQLGAAYAVFGRDGNERRFATGKSNGISFSAIESAYFDMERKIDAQAGSASMLFYDRLSPKAGLVDISLARSPDLARRRVTKLTHHPMRSAMFIEDDGCWDGDAIDVRTASRAQRLSNGLIRLELPRVSGKGEPHEKSVGLCVDPAMHSVIRYAVTRYRYSDGSANDRSRYESFEYGEVSGKIVPMRRSVWEPASTVAEDASCVRCDIAYSWTFDAEEVSELCVLADYEEYYIIPTGSRQPNVVWVVLSGLLLVLGGVIVIRATCSKSPARGDP